MSLSRKENALSLYNAIAGTDYKDTNELEIVTLEDALYMTIKNDLALYIDNRFVMFEHQSTVNPNMPLRGLEYYAQLYENYVQRKGLNLYGTKETTIPAPLYIVIYNGLSEVAELTEYKLSDSFARESKGYEWTTYMLNINVGHNDEIMKSCRKLYEYSRFTQLVRENYKKCGTIELAVDTAISTCINEELLVNYLTVEKAKVKKMISHEFNEEKYAEGLKEEGTKIGEIKTTIKIFRDDFNFADEEL